MSQQQDERRAHYNTASIVDISELDEDEQEQEQEHQHEASGRPGCAPSMSGARQQAAGATTSSASASQQLFLFHEEPASGQLTISSLLSSGGHLHLPGAGGANCARSARSAESSPAQTLAREGAGSALPALDYHRRAPSPGATGGHESQDFSNFTQTLGNADTKHQDQQEDKQTEKANLGTLTGVYFPCVQNIFGVILFIRMVWIVGTAGVPAAFALVLICCCVTLTTSISLSAIATNGIVPAGGSYFMISRSLGPECGGAVGTMFFLGTTVAGAMYITGAVEIMLNYLAPSWGLFGDFQRDVNIMYHNIRVYGSLLLIIVGLMVWLGVKFVSKLAPIALFCVLFSIASIYAGILINYNGRPDLMLCVLGDRLVTLKNIPYDESAIANELQAHSFGGFGGGGGQSGALVARGANQTMSAREMQQLHELRRTRSLCTYEKLRYIFCPNTERAQQQQQTASVEQENLQAGQKQQQQQQQQLTAQQQQEQLMRDLFSRPPNMSNCDAYFLKNRNQIHLERAVPGIASGVLFKNLKPRFRRKGTLVSYDDDGELDWGPAQQQQQQGAYATGARPQDQADQGAEQANAGGGQQAAKNGYNLVFVDITTSFTILISIYFPSCTGILAGSNRSGDLADAQRSIPRGTIGAQLCTSFVYLSCILLFGATFNNLFIRDKFGESMGGQLAVTQIAWPEPYFILIGGLLSTLGAALQSLVGAPRILQGIAKDDVIPCFRRFAKLNDRGEPETAILFTLAISWIAVLIGNLDFIAPILTIFLVMCYFFINLACTLHSLLGSPNWRPRFKHYHWSISTLGCFLCLFVMIVSSWIYFLIAILMACCIYKYIEFSGAQKEWGDGKQGLALSAATYNLLRLRTSEPHTKNWRPQLLLFCKLKPSSELEQPFSKAQQRQAASLQAIQAAGSNQTPLEAFAASQTAGGDGGAVKLALAHPKLLTFASQLKAGKGLTLVSSVIEGHFQQCARQAQEARSALQEQIQRERVRGFADVLVASSISDGLCYQIQTAGLGGLKHNTVILGWPAHWRKPIVPAKPAVFAAPNAAAAAAAAAAATATGAAHTRAHLFIDMMRNVQASQNALLVVKGVDSWPESCDKLGGFIDIWWIVNDGGLLMLLPHLLKQHRTWKSCQLRIFTVAQASDNSDQMREDLAKFLYHLRIQAKVDIVVMKDTEISDYAYERTLMMEQRSEIIKRLDRNRKQSILLEQEVDGRLIRFRIRKPSVYELDGYDSASSGAHLVGTPVSASASDRALPMVELQSSSSRSNGAACDQQQPATAASGAQQADGAELAAADAQQQQQQQQRDRLQLANLRPDETNVRRMHTALSLNEAILRRSKQAKLVIINLPGAPKDTTPEAENNYMEFIEIITDKLERVILVQNGGREVITIHS